MWPRRSRRFRGQSVDDPVSPDPSRREYHPLHVSSAARKIRTTSIGARNANLGTRARTGDRAIRDFRLPANWCGIGSLYWEHAAGGFAKSLDFATVLEGMGP